MPGRTIPQNITVLTTTFPRNDNDHCGQFILQLLQNLPFQFSVVTPADQCSAKLSAENITSHCFTGFGLFYGGGTIYNLRKQPWRILAILPAMLSMSIAGFQSARRSRIIWSHWAVPAGLIGSFFQIIFRKPHVLTLHSGDVWLLENIPTGAMLARFIGAHSDMITASSQDVLDRFAMLGKTNGRVLSCGVVENNATKDAGCQPRVGTLSRLVPSKGILPLIKVIDNLDAELHIAGDGPERHAMQMHAKQHVGKLVLHGPVVGEIKAQHLRNLSVFLAPYTKSAWQQGEGLPVAILEAIAADCAVVAFKSAIPNNFLEHNISCIIVDDADYPALIAGANRILNDEQLKKRLIKKAQEQLQPHKMPYVASQWTALIHSMQ